MINGSLHGVQFLPVTKTMSEVQLPKVAVTVNEVPLGIPVIVLLVVLITPVLANSVAPGVNW